MRKRHPRALAVSQMCADSRPCKGEAWQCEGSEGALLGLPGSCVLQQGLEQDSVAREAGEGTINWMSGVIGP